MTFSLLRMVASDAAIYAVGPQLNRLAGFLMLPFLTPFLTAWDYGVLALVTACVSACDGVRDLGLQVNLTNSFFQQPATFREEWRRVLGLLTVWSLILGVLVTPVFVFILPAEARSRALAVCLYAIVPLALFGNVSQIGRSYLQLNRRPKVILFISVAGTVLGVGLNYVCIVGLRLGFLGFLISNAATQALTFVILLQVVCVRERLWPTFRWPRPWVREQLALSLPMVPHYYSGFLLNLSDRFFLKMLGVPTTEIGNYSFGYTLGTVFSGAGKAFSQAATPPVWALLAKEDDRAEREVRRLLFLCQALFFCAGFIFSVWAREVIHFVARNPSLKDSYQYAPLVIMAYTYFPSYAGAIWRLRYAGKTRVFWRISFAAGLLNIGLNLILVPFGGAMAAAVTTFLSYLYMAFSGFCTADYRRTRRLDFHERYWLYGLVLLTAAAILMQLAGPWLKVVVTLGTVGCAAAALSAWKRFERS